MSISVSQSLQFLVDDFGYTYSFSQLNDLHVLFYKNENAEKQLEVAYNERYFHCEIRRLIEGKPAKYSDRSNSISHNDLARLEIESNYNDLDCYAGGSLGLEAVVNNFSELLKRLKGIFTSANWFDTEKLVRLKDDDFHKRHGFYPTKGIKSFFDLLKEEATTILKQKGYAVIKDSKEGPPYDTGNYTHHIVFFRLYNKIVISQSDWRDNYNIYYITRNDKKIIEIDITEKSFEDALKLMTAKLTYL